MPANLTDNYVANTYRGVLHVNGEELPDVDKIQVYDGAGNETAIKLGSNSIDCLSLSAQGLTANNFKYPDEPGNRFSILAQVSDSSEGEVNTLELRDIQDVFCSANAGASYSRSSNSAVPVIETQCGLVRSVNDVEVTNITAAAGGIDTDQTGNFIISSAFVQGGIVKRLTLLPATLSPQPNLLINAQGMINQRGASPSSNLSSISLNEKRYFLDRWKSIVNNTASWSYNSNGNIATITAPGGGISQIIERINIVPGRHILTWRGNAIANIIEAGTSKGTGNGGTGEIKILFVDLAGTGDVEIKFTDGIFSLPKFERGNIRTEFDYRNVASELALCQRYYEVLDLTDNIWKGRKAGTADPTFGHAVSFGFKVTKRAVPRVVSSIQSAAGMTQNVTTERVRFNGSGLYYVYASVFRADAEI